MANNGADIYLILLRPSRVPVMGEAVSHLFQGQVLIESLNWNLHNEDAKKTADLKDNEWNERKNLVEQSGSAKLRAKQKRENAERAAREARSDADLAYSRAMEDADEAYSKTVSDNDTDRKKQYQAYLSARDSADETYDRAMAKADGREHRSKTKLEKEREQEDLVIQKARSAIDEEISKEQAEAVAEADRNPNFEFTFRKRVDIATSQLLNSMKAGDVFPSATLTIHKRSSTMMDGTSLVFSIQRIRLLDYQVQVVVTDTMTEMMEEWTAEFGALAYLYKNPPSHYAHGSGAQAVAKTISQGTMRGFTMKGIGSPI